MGYNAAATMTRFMVERCMALPVDCCSLVTHGEVPQFRASASSRNERNDASRARRRKLGLHERGEQLRKPSHGRSMLVCALCALTAGAAFAQDYPTRPVRL